MATKKTAKKASKKSSGSRLPSDSPTSAGMKQAALDERATGPKYATIGDVMRAKAKGALPRGAKFVIVGGRARFGVGTQTLLDVDASEVARWGLRKAGFKAEHAA